MLQSLQKRLRERQLAIRLTDTAKAKVIDEGYDPAFGARPLRRYLQSKVETLIGRTLIASDVPNGSELVIDCGSDGFQIKINAMKGE